MHADATENKAQTEDVPQEKAEVFLKSNTLLCSLGRATRSLQLPNEQAGLYRYLGEELIYAWLSTLSIFQDSGPRGFSDVNTTSRRAISEHSSN